MRNSVGEEEGGGGMVFSLSPGNSGAPAGRPCSCCCRRGRNQQGGCELCLKGVWNSFGNWSGCNSLEMIALRFKEKE